MPVELKQSRTVGGFTFELDSENNMYECRGGTYHDEDHDQVPEPKLQQAAYALKSILKTEGHTAEIEFGEKGWIELNLIS